MFNLRRIENKLLEGLISQYDKEQTKENKEKVFREMENTWFIVPILNEDVENNTYEIEWVKDFQDKVYLPIFTSLYQLSKYKGLKAKHIVICNFKLVLKMFESIEDTIYNIVINPYGKEMNLTKIDIARYRKEFNTAIYREDLNYMDYLNLPKNMAVKEIATTTIDESCMPILFKKEVLTIARLHAAIDKVYIIAKFNKKELRNEYTIVLKINKEYTDELHLEQIHEIFMEYLDKDVNTIELINYIDYKDKKNIQKMKPFFEKNVQKN